MSSTIPTIKFIIFTLGKGLKAAVSGNLGESKKYIDTVQTLSERKRKREREAEKILHCLYCHLIKRCLLISLYTTQAKRPVIHGILST